MEDLTYNQICCPKCGSRNFQAVNETNVQTKGKNYSSGQGCLGYLLLGPLGLLCGTCGQGQKTTVTNKLYYVCGKCGEKFRRPEDLRKEIKDTKTVINVILPIFTLIGILLILAGNSVDSDMLSTLGIIYTAIFIVSFALLRFIYLPKKQKENEDIINRMNEFLREDNV